MNLSIHLVLIISLVLMLPLSKAEGITSDSVIPRQVIDYINGTAVDDLIRRRRENPMQYPIQISTQDAKLLQAARKFLFFPLIPAAIAGFFVRKAVKTAVKKVTGVDYKKAIKKEIRKQAKDEFQDDIDSTLMDTIDVFIDIADFIG